MPTPESLLQQACEAAEVALEDLATWARLDAQRLQSAVAGGVRLSASELDQCARVLGLRLDDLLAGEGGRAPMTLLLRDANGLALDLRTVLSAEMQDALGEFQRVVRDVDELERLLELGRITFARLPTSPAPPGVHPGDHRARLLRQALGLGEDPIPSMRALAERCGVAIVWVTNDQVDQSVDGACTAEPRPAVLVNLPEGGQAAPWRMRITLAHELGHLFFDVGAGAPRALLSPAGRAPNLDEIERNARALAACFLAPTEGVRRLASSLDPTSEAAIVAVGSMFGVGRTVAINRLHHVFGLSADQRDHMERRAGTNYQGNFADDQPPQHLGFRGDPLRTLVERALERRKIGAGRARALLGLSASEPLPFVRLGAELCAPSLPAEGRILREVYRYLADRGSDLIAGPPSLVDGRWRVPLREGGGDSAGHLFVSLGGVVEGVRADSTSERPR
jgi:Zn-dependent peptidase ImmA (M78 family)